MDKRNYHFEVIYYLPGGGWKPGAVSVPADNEDEALRLADRLAQHIVDEQGFLGHSQLRLKTDPGGEVDDLRTDFVPPEPAAKEG